MEYGITGKLQKKLKLPKLAMAKETELSFCWDINFELINRKMMLFIVNSSSRFATIAYGLTPNDVRDNGPEIFKSLICKAMKDVLYLNDTQIEQYFVLAGKAVLTKTHGRAAVAALNRLVSDMGYAWEYNSADIDTAETYQSAMTAQANSLLCHSANMKTQKDYSFPADLALADLQALKIDVPSESEKYVKIAQKFRDDGADEWQVKKFMKEVREHDELLQAKHLQGDGGTSRN